MGRIALTAIVIAVVVGFVVVGPGLPSRAADPVVQPAAPGIAGVEVPQLRTAHSRTFRQPDGSLQARISAAPVNFQDASGRWLPIDNGLRRLANGSVENRANSFKVDIPASAAGEVSVAHEGRRLAFSLVGARRAAVDPAGAEASFDNALPHVDVAYEARGASLKETLTLDAAVAPASYAFALDAPGLRAVEEPSGAVSFVDAAGHQRFRFASPWMQDADGALSRSASYVVHEAGGVQSVELRLDRKWLGDPARRFPVRVDPTIGGEPELGCQLISGSHANVSDCSEEPWVWIARYEEELWRGLITLPSPSEIIEPEALVTDSSLQFWFEEQTEAASSSIELYGVTRASNGSATWNRATSSTAWSTAGGDLMPAPESTQTLLPEHIEALTGMGATRLAQGWVDGSDTLHELMIKRAHEEVEHGDLIGGFEIIIDYRFRTGFDPDLYTYDHTGLSDGSSLDYNAASGNVTLFSNDGFPTSHDPRLMLGRYWNTQNTQDAADVGTFGLRARGDVGTIKLSDGDFGASYYLAGLSGADEVFVKHPGGAFEPTDGKDIDLTQHEDGSVTLRFNETSSTWEFSRASPHRLVRVSESGGYTLEATYSEAGRLARLRDSEGLTATFAYTEGGDLRTVTDQSEGVRRYAFDGSHRLTSYTSPEAAVTRYTYDGSGRMTRIDLPDRTALKLAYFGGSGVVGSLTPVNTENRDGERTTVDAEAGYWTIEHPRVHSVTYFHDNHLDVSVVQRGDGPGIAASGDVVAATPTYDRGAAPYAIDTRSAGVPNGVQEVHLTANGSTADTLRARCEGGCPQRLDGTLRFDPRSQPEGLYRLQLHAEDGESHTATSDTWTIHLDRTAPSSSAEEITADYDERTTETHIDWNAAVDPDLEDRTPGSPIATYTHRYKLNSGEWTSWTNTATPGFTIAATDGRESVDVEIKATDAAGNTGSTVSDTVRAVEAGPVAPSNTRAPTVAGSPQDGEQLSARPGTWSGTGPISYRYQWQVCDESGLDCDDVTGATRRALALDSGDVGTRLRVHVIAVNAGGTTSADSAATDAVGVRRPTREDPPQATGVAEVGATLEAAGATFTGTGPFTSGYQWRRCDEEGFDCADIEGATSVTYEVQMADLGATLRVVESATNASGTDSATSFQSAVVVERDLISTDLPTIAVQGGVFGEELVADPGTWSGTGPIAYVYAWQRCDVSGTACTGIPGAAAQTYLLSPFDVGHALRVLVTAYGASDSASATSAPTDAYAATRPANAAVPTIAGAPYVGQSLSLDAGAWSGTQPIALAFQWRRCNAEGSGCADIEDATDDVYEPVAEDLEATLRVTVTATNTSGSASESSAATMVVHAATELENRTAPSVSGDPYVGEELTADPGTWNGTGAISYTYQWRRCDSLGDACEDVGGADEATYEVQGADAGSVLRVAVTVSDELATATVVAGASGPAMQAEGPASTVAPAISGTAAEGATLTATSGTWSGSGSISYAYQWQACDILGCVDVADATASTYAVTSEDVGWTLRVAVTATDDEGPTTAVSTASGSVVAGTLLSWGAPTISGRALTGETLTADQGSWSQAASYAYQWRRCDAEGEACSAIGGATASSYRLVEADSGSTVRVLVTASNLGGSTEAASAPSAVVDAVAPVSDRAPAVSGTAAEGETLTATEGDWTGDDSVTLQWQRCDAEGGECHDVPGRDDDEYTLRRIDVGDTLRVVATAHNANGSTDAASTASGVVAAAELAATAPPTISGTVADGQTLTGHAGTWSGTPTISYAYQWQSCDARGEHCAAIEGETSTTHALESADLGTRLRLVVTASNPRGSQTLVSDPTDVVLMALPVNTVAPRLTGDAIDGSALSVSDGTWTGTALALSYQWQRCDAEGARCVDIAGATTDELTLAAIDIGATVRARVTATNARDAVTVASDVSDPVAAQEPANTNGPTIEGAAVQGRTLRADQGEWSGTPTLSYAYQWQRCDTLGAMCVAIEGATNLTYVLVSGDVEATIRVVVTATNAAGSAEAASDVTALVDAPHAPRLESSPSVWGSPFDGRVLEAETGGLGGDEPFTYTAQWERCNSSGEACRAIGGATEFTYELTEADIGATVRVHVTVENVDGSDDGYSAVTAVIGSGAPANDSPATVEGYVFSNLPLTAYPGQWSGSGPISYTYQWRSCDAEGAECEDIEGATDATYRPTDAEVGATMRLVVAARNAHGTVTSTSEATAAVLQGPPLNTRAPAISGTTLVGQQLTASDGEWTPTPDTVFYAWQRCDEAGENCELVPFAWTSRYTLTAADLGKRIKLLIFVQRSGVELYGEGVSAPTAVVSTVSPLNLVPPAVSGTPAAGELLSADEGTWAGDTPTSYGYQWQSCSSGGTSCRDIDGATNATYAIRIANAGATLRVVVTAENGAGSSTGTSAVTAAVATPSDDYLPPVDIEGDPIVGSSVNARTHDTIFGLELAFRWERCDAEGEGCELIPNARFSEYKIQLADAGSTLRVAISDFSTAWEAAIRVSPMSDVVVAADAAENIEAPTISGDAEPDELLTAESGSWSGSPEIDYEVQWLRCDTEGSACDDIDGATDSAYRVAEGDAEGTIRARVTATNGAGSVSVDTAATSTVPAPAPLANLTLPSIDAFGTPSLYDLIDTNEGTWAGAPRLTDSWQRCDPLAEDVLASCEDIPDSTGVGALTGIYVAAIADAGYLLRIKETATTATDSETVYSDVTEDVISDSPGENGLGGTYTGHVAAGQTVTAHPSLHAQEGIPITFNYRFQRLDAEENIITLQDSADPSYTFTAEDVSYEAWVKVEASAWRVDRALQLGTNDQYIDFSLVEPEPTNDDVPTIDGELVVGGDLTADPGTWHGGDETLAFTYQWQRCDEGGEGCVAIDDATEPRYIVEDADFDGTLRVQVTAHAGAGSGTAGSAATSMIDAATPLASTTPPAITGTPVELETLTADTGSWSGSRPSFYTYQWQRCDVNQSEACEDIEGAEDPTYTLNDQDVGSGMRVVVVATNGDGDLLATSAMTAEVTAAATPTGPDPQIALLGPPAPGSLVTSSASDWVHVEDDEFTYQWQRCDAMGTECEDIPEATRPYHSITDEDVDARLRVVISAANSGGAATASSALTDIVVAGVASARERMAVAGDSELTLANLDGTDAEPVVTCEDLVPDAAACRFTHPRIAPSGMAITAGVVSFDGDGSPRPDRIAVVNVDGTGARLLDAEGDEPTWAGQGMGVVFASSSVDEGDDQTHIYGVRADGLDDDQPTRLVDGEGEQRAPSFSSDERRLVYMQRSEGAQPWDLYVLDGDDSEPRHVELGPAARRPTGPTFSPDGTSIVFSASPPNVIAGPEETVGVFSTGIDGSHLRMLTSRKDTHFERPAVAPDGSIATERQGYIWTSTGFGGFWTTTASEMSRMQADGTGLRPYVIDGSSNSVELGYGSGPVASAAVDLVLCPTKSPNGPIYRTDGNGDGTGDPNVIVRGWYRGRCGSQSSYLLKLCIEMRGGSDNKYHQQKCDGDEPRIVSAQNLVDQKIDLLCRPGTRWYRLIAEVSWPSPVRRTKVPIFSDDHFEVHESVAHQLNCNEAGAFRFQASHSMEFIELPARPVSRGTALGAALRRPGAAYQDIPPGGLPARGTGGWAAHHIVLAGGTAMDVEKAQRIAYDCLIKPNAAVNGIWLRGPSLKKGTDGYAHLNSDAKLRPYHPEVHTEDYARLVRRILEGEDGEELADRANNCDVHHQFKARTVIHEIATLLSLDLLPFRGPDHLPGEGN